MTTQLVNQFKTYNIRFDNSEDNISWRLMDPAYEFPKFAVAVGVDANLLIRPLNTFVLAAAAEAAFIGYVAAGAFARGDDAFPQITDYGQKARVYHSGVVEVSIEPPSAIVVEGLFLVPTAASGRIVDHEFVLSATSGTTATPWVITGETLSQCPSFTEDPCSVAAAPADVSLTDELGVVTRGRVHARWNTTNFIPAPSPA